MTARRGHTQEGKRSPHALSITGPRRFLVIEFDLGRVTITSRCFYIWPKPKAR